MKTKTVIFLLGCCLLLSAAAILAFLFNINPYITDGFTLAVFYGSVFVFITALLTILGWWFRFRLTNQEVFYAHLSVSFRQAVLIGLWITAILVMSTVNILTIWDAAILFISVIFIELFFRTRIIVKKQK